MSYETSWPPKAVPKTSPHRGLSACRWESNPEERRIALAWYARQAQGTTLDYLLWEDPFQSGRPPMASERDALVAATVVQWLGSPVGQEFFRELGYVKVEELKKQIEPKSSTSSTTLDRFRKFLGMRY